jgi:multisubunit Na+/H+ antiporter MnhC subunit
MVLTSLVITFAATALLLSLVFRVYGAFRSLESPDLAADAGAEPGTHAHPGRR